MASAPGVYGAVCEEPEDTGGEEEGGLRREGKNRYKWGRKAVTAFAVAAGFAFVGAVLDVSSSGRPGEGGPSRAQGSEVNEATVSTDGSYEPLDDQAVKGRLVDESSSTAALLEEPVVAAALAFEGEEDNSEETFEDSDDTTFEDETQKTMDFATFNKYSDPSVGGSPPGGQYPWVMDPYKLVEPYKDTTFYPTVGKTDGGVWEDTAPGYTFSWDIDGTSYEGNTVVHTFLHVGTFDVTVSKIDVDDGKVIDVISDSVICKYVRREIRELMEEDREAYFGAHLEIMAVTYNDDGDMVYKDRQTSIDEGREKYGDRFTTLMDLASEHNKLGGALDCDHMHDGMGMLGIHTELTLRYELALQAVDPSVSVPYWDYTRDDDDPMQSIVFNDEWFGQVANEEPYVITSGRWKHLPMGFDEGEEGSHNGYGFMRAPWNPNNYPYVTRSNHLLGDLYSEFSGCYEHFDALQKTTWSDFSWYIPYDGHSPVHKSIGGNMFANWRTILVDENNYDIVNFKDKWLLAQKEFFRDGVLDCPTYCSLDTAPGDCKCTCGDLSSYFDEYSDYITEDNPIGDKYEFLKNYLHPKPVTNSDGDDLTEVFLRLLCNDYPDLNPFIGDMLSSSSAFDIAFWPIHPTLDRILTWKRIQGFEDETWADDDDAYVAGYACYGHGENDELPWKMWIDEDPTKFQTPTNREFYDIATPDAPNLPYIYDSFAWPHCVDQGYDIDLLNAEDWVETKLTITAVH